jgi:hypothetical protein
MTIQWRRVLTLMAGLILAAGVGLNSYHSTGSTEVGVRVRKLSLFGRQGVDDAVYQPGATYFFLPVLNEWNTFDTRLHIVEMKAANPAGKPRDLAFKTIEGNDINLDVVFSYRIDPARAGYIRQFVAANDRELEEKVFATVARSRTRDFFGALTTQQFYRAEERNRAAENARTGLQEILGTYGIIVEKVGLMDYRFKDDYTKVIEQKKLAEAETLKLQAEIEAQREMNKKLLNDADGIVNEMVARTDGIFTNTVAAADAYLDRMQQVAMATIRKAENEASVVQSNRLAMASAGGEMQIKMRIAQSLKGKPIVMMPGNDGGPGGLNVRTFDVNDFLKTSGLLRINERK